MLDLSFDARLRYDEELDSLFLNFEGLEVKTIKIVDACREKIRAICAPLGRKVYAIANYDGFVLDRDIEDATANAKLGDALVTRAWLYMFSSRGRKRRPPMRETVLHQ